MPIHFFAFFAKKQNSIIKAGDSRATRTLVDLFSSDVLGQNPTQRPVPQIAAPVGAPTGLARACPVCPASAHTGPNQANAGLGTFHLAMGKPWACPYGAWCNPDPNRGFYSLNLG